MALTEVDSGTQAATLDTEHTLSTQTTGKTFCLAVDLSNMVAGDIVVLRLKTKVLTGGSSILAYSAIYGPIPPSQDAVYSVPVPAVHELVATLEQTDGTGRSFPWSLISLD